MGSFMGNYLTGGDAVEEPQAAGRAASPEDQFVDANEIPPGKVVALIVDSLIERMAKEACESLELGLLTLEDLTGKSSFGLTCVRPTKEEEVEV